MTRRQLQKRKQFFTELIDETRGNMMLFAQVRVEDKTLADDLVQEVCMTAWMNLDKVMDSPNPKGWLINALKIHIRKYYKSVEREKKKFEALTELEMDEEYTPEMLEEIAFSGELSTEEMLILKLREQGYQYHEIAKELGMKSATIHTKVSRMKKKLEKYLKASGYIW